MKTFLIAGALAGLSTVALAQVPAATDPPTAAAAPSPQKLAKADRQKLKADRKQLKHDRSSGNGISRANDKQTVTADRAQLSSDTGHIVGRKHGGARRGGQQ